MIVRFLKVVQWMYRTVNTWLSTGSLRLLFRLNGIRFGARCRAIGVPSIRVSLGGRATFGNNLYWRTGNGETNVGHLGSRLRVGPRGVLSVGNHVGMSNATIVCHESVAIGDHVNLGGGVQIFDTNFHSLKPEVRNSGKETPADVRTRPVRIGNGCLIGTNAMICKGVEIGENAIVGAGSVVVCSIPAGEVWAGNPARKIR